MIFGKAYSSRTYYCSHSERWHRLPADVLRRITGKMPRPRHADRIKSLKGPARASSTSNTIMVATSWRPTEISSTTADADDNHSGMKRNCNLALIGTLLGAGMTVSGLAGPEPIADYSTDKNVVEQKVEQECNWYVSIGGGADFDYGTTEFNRARTIPGASGLAEIDVASHDYNDVYDTNYRIQGEVGYALGQHIELFGRFSYDAAGSQTTGGSVVRSIAGNLALESNWSDYNSYGGELGVRYFFLSRRACLRPYISLSGGATRVESIDLTTRAANNFGPFAAGDVLFDGRFYGNSVVATGSVLAGFEVPVTRCFAIGADAGLRYESKLAQDDNDLDRATFAGAGFPNLNKLNDNAGDRLFCPVTLYAKIRF